MKKSRIFSIAVLCTALAVGVSVGGGAEALSATGVWAWASIFATTVVAGYAAYAWATPTFIGNFFSQKSFTSSCLAALMALSSKLHSYFSYVKHNLDQLSRSVWRIQLPRLQTAL